MYSDIPTNLIINLCEEQFAKSDMSYEQIRLEFQKEIQYYKSIGFICIYERNHPALGTEVHLINKKDLLKLL